MHLKAALPSRFLPIGKKDITGFWAAHIVFFGAQGALKRHKLKI
jgi:hypothetical protein